MLGARPSDAISLQLTAYQFSIMRRLFRLALSVCFACLVLGNNSIEVGHFGLCNRLDVLSLCVLVDVERRRYAFWLPAEGSKASKQGRELLTRQLDGADRPGRD